MREGIALGLSFLLHANCQSSLQDDYKLIDAGWRAVLIVGGVLIDGSIRVTWMGSRWVGDFKDFIIDI